jgi:hypothetical protein
MNKKKSHARFSEIPTDAQKTSTTKSTDTDTDTGTGTNTEYDDFELLEHLESLQEEMEDLGVSTLAEVVERIATLHHRLDEE